jgi:3-dehydroquinate synthetase
MERAAWTDQRLDDLAEAMRTGFARVHQDIRDLRAEVAGLRVQMHDGFGELRGEVNDLRAEFRTVMLRIGGGVIVGLIGVIAAILASGG